MSASVNTSRRVTSWITSFVKLLDGVSTPYDFKVWTAVGAVAGALERRVWVKTAKSILYPNMYILLVSPPGVGKTQSIVWCNRIWNEVGDLNVAPDSITNKGLVDTLAESGNKKNHMLPDGTPIEKYHSLLVGADEFGVFLPHYELDFINTLNKLYDAPPIFKERTRGGGTVTITNPSLHILAGTQPKYLSELLPEAAFGMGFTARMIMVYVGKAEKVDDLFGDLTPELDKEELNLYKDLVKDLKTISQLTGQFKITQGAKDKLANWYKHEQDIDRQHHSKLQNYNTRRILHILKLCQVFSAARTNDMIITEEDLKESMDLLLYTEQSMPEIFKEMTMGGQQAEIEEAFNFVVRLSLSSGSKKPVPESRLTQFLASRVPLYQINLLIETMLRAGLIKEAAKGKDELNLNTPGHRLFWPADLNATE